MTMADAERLLRPGRMLIGEDLVAEASGGEYEHVNPATGQLHPAIPLAGQAEVQRAVETAHAGQPLWYGLPADARRDAMLRLASLIKDRTDELAMLMSLDTGSPFQNAKASGPRGAADHITYFAGWADKVGGEVIPTWPAPAFDYAVREPYGVIGAIIPWNVVLHNIGQVLGPALAAGNAVVLKAPELAPFAALRFGELILEAGIPPGVVNIVAGGAECGRALVAHPGVDKVHFIGSGATARQVMVAAAEELKPVTVELGGKSANLVFADADLDAAARYATFLSMANAGQGCLLPTRLLVEDVVYEPVVEAVAGLAKSMHVGDPFDAETAIGPVITAEACERILGVIDQARSEGSGRLVAGGGRVGEELGGHFVQPTVFADVENGSALAQHEIFGPVLAIIRFSDEAEAVRLANDTRYGLAAYLHTNDLRRAHRVARGLEAGMVYVNGFSGVHPAAPFGGVKQSGFGRMGGRYGLDDFLHVKNVYIPLR